jgi:hypothetical protein
MLSPPKPPSHMRRLQAALILSAPTQSLTCLSPPREAAIGTRHRLCSSPPCSAASRPVTEPPSHAAPPRASRRCHAPERRHRTRCLLRAIPSELRARGTHHRSIPHREECPTIVGRPWSPSKPSASTKSSSTSPCASLTTPVSIYAAPLASPQRTSPTDHPSLWTHLYGESPPLPSPKLSSSHAGAALAPFPNPVAPLAHRQSASVTAQPSRQAASPVLAVGRKGQVGQTP